MFQLPTPLRPQFLAFLFLKTPLLQLLVSQLLWQLLWLHLPQLLTTLLLLNAQLPQFLMLQLLRFLRSPLLTAQLPRLLMTQLLTSLLLQLLTARPPRFLMFQLLTALLQLLTIQLIQFLIDASVAGYKAGIL